MKQDIKLMLTFLGILYLSLGSRKSRDCKDIRVRIRKSLASTCTRTKESTSVQELEYNKEHGLRASSTQCTQCHLS